MRAREKKLADPKNPYSSSCQSHSPPIDVNLADIANKGFEQKQEAEFDSKYRSISQYIKRSTKLAKPFDLNDYVRWYNDVSIIRDEGFHQIHGGDEGKKQTHGRNKAHDCEDQESIVDS